MIKVVDTLYSKLPDQFGPVGQNTTITAGMMLYNNFTANALAPVTSSVGTTENLAGVATSNLTTGSGGSGTIKYKPLDHAVFVVADCTNNTATNQLLLRHVMTDANTVNNSSSDTATTLAIFHALGVVGTATNKKLYGYFIRLDQVAT